jgi:hypothetical protein
VTASTLTRRHESGLLCARPKDCEVCLCFVENMTVHHGLLVPFHIKIAYSIAIREVTVGPLETRPARKWISCLD